MCEHLVMAWNIATYLTFIWEGNLPIEDAGSVKNARYNNVWLVPPSLYAKWEL